MGIAEVYASRDYCLAEMGRVRDMWGSRTMFTPEAIEAARTSLGFMFLYCPPDLSSMVETHLDELSRREIMYVLTPRPRTAEPSSGKGQG